MGKDLLAIAETVANEKDVDRAIIFEALEAALAVATRKKFADVQVDARVVINRQNGEYFTYRQWTIVDDDDILENPDAQMRHSVAKIEFPNEDLAVGDVHKILIENESFGRISAQQAKQIIIQKLREAEREKVYQQFIDKEGQLLYATVRRHERRHVIVDVGGVEATILREGMIPRENLRPGDRVRGYLEKVNRELKGPQLTLSRVVPEFLAQLFTLEVPEIGMGVIEIMGVARIPGIRAKVAVRTSDPRIDPTGACVGMRGSRVQIVKDELAGEMIDVILWDEDIETYVRHAMSPAVITQTYLHESRQEIDIAVPEEKLAQAVGRAGQNVRLACELSAMTINVLSETQFKEKMQRLQSEQKSVLGDMLAIDATVVDALTNAGYHSVEEVAYAEMQDLLAITSLDEEIVEHLLERASDCLLAQAFSSQTTPQEQMQTPLAEIDDIAELDAQTIDILLQNDLKTQEDLAELSVDELIEITNIEQPIASAIILKAREPWFR